MAERIRESEVNRLRQVVGLGAGEAKEEAEIPKVPTRDDVSFEAPPASGDTTLFVKIDEHEAVSLELAKSRKDIKAMANTIELLGKAEKLKAEAIARMEENLDLLDAKINDMEPKLQAPEGLTGGDAASEAGSVYSDTLSDLKSELARIKTELKGPNPQVQ